MKKDLFVDNNVAKNFSNPLDNEYKELVAWLKSEGALVVSNKLIGEYIASSGASGSLTNIAVIINHLLVHGRLNKVSSSQLRSFQFPNHVARVLRSNRADHVHLKTVLLSNRKLAITIDGNLRHDINNYPRLGAIAGARPQDVPYK